MRVAIARGAEIMSDCGQAAEQPALPLLFAPERLFRLTHSSLNAVTSSCVPESGLLESGAPEGRAPGSERATATGLSVRSGAWPRP